MKTKTFKSKITDIEIVVYPNAWIEIYNKEEYLMTLGIPENTRIKMLEKAIKYARKIKVKQ